jgi:hypothetical protein
MTAIARGDLKPEPGDPKVWFIQGSLLATADMDLLWEPDARLRLVGEVDADGLIGLLRRADRSFERHGSQPFRAVNRDGYWVDLIRPLPRPPLRVDQRQRIGSESDLSAVEIEGQQWLVAAPVFKAVVIGHDGLPAPMVCPDPRAFALHKAWLGQQPDRNPVKRQRDLAQAQVVHALIGEHLPMLRFDAEDLRCFPAKVRRAALNAFEDRPWG